MMELSCTAKARNPAGFFLKTRTESGLKFLRPKAWTNIPRRKKARRPAVSFEEVKIMVFHEGELAVQERVGVSRQANRVGGSIHPAIPPLAQDFLAQQPYVFAASIDAKGRVWASLLSGEVGFLKVLSDRTIRIDSPATDNLLFENLKTDDR